MRVDRLNIFICLFTFIAFSAKTRPTVFRCCHSKNKHERTISLPPPPRPPTQHRCQPFEDREFVIRRGVTVTALPLNRHSRLSLRPTVSPLSRSVVFKVHLRITHDYIIYVYCWFFFSSIHSAALKFNGPTVQSSLKPSLGVRLPDTRDRYGFAGFPTRGRLVFLNLTVYVWLGLFFGVVRGRASYIVFFCFGKKRKNSMIKLLSF